MLELGSFISDRDDQVRPGLIAFDSLSRVHTVPIRRLTGKQPIVYEGDGDSRSRTGLLTKSDSLSRAHTVPCRRLTGKQPVCYV